MCPSRLADEGCGLRLLPRPRPSQGTAPPLAVTAPPHRTSLRALPPRGSSWPLRHCTRSLLWLTSFPLFSPAAIFASSCAVKPHICFWFPLSKSPLPGRHPLAGSQSDLHVRCQKRAPPCLHACLLVSLTHLRERPAPGARGLARLVRSHVSSTGNRAW